MKSTSFKGHRRSARGFTLVELMMTIVVAAVIAGIAVPNMRTFILNNRLTSSASELLRSLQSARSEAAKRQKNIVLCMSANAASTPTTATCATTGTTGWIVFEDADSDWVRDTDEVIIDVNTYDPNKIFLLLDGSQKISFAASGFANPAGASVDTQTPSTAVVICDSRGNASVGGQSTARGLDVNGTGRARMMRTTTEIDEVLAKLGSSCPP